MVILEVHEDRGFHNDDVPGAICVGKLASMTASVRRCYFSKREYPVVGGVREQICYGGTLSVDKDPGFMKASASALI